MNMGIMETVKYMRSGIYIYEDRFKAEYYQAVIRYKLLKEMLEKWDNGTLEFTPPCNRGIYNFQERAMADYIACLETRAMIENIDLSVDEDKVSE